VPALVGYAIDATRPGGNGRTPFRPKAVVQASP
jgi:hypothetical protein